MFSALTTAFGSLCRLLETNSGVQRLYIIDNSMAGINNCILNPSSSLSFLIEVYNIHICTTSSPNFGCILQPENTISTPTLL